MAERITPFTKSFDEQYARHIVRYNLAADYVKGGRILDIACGSGYGARLLAEHASHVVGGDISEEAILFARRHYGWSNLAFCVADAASLGFRSGIFDAIVSFETLEHVDNPTDIIDEFYRLLRDDGILIVSVPNGDIDKIDGNEFHKQYFRLDEFKQLLVRRFSVIKIAGQRKSADTRFKCENIARVTVPAFLKNVIPQAVRESINRFRYRSDPPRESDFSLDSSLDSAEQWVAVCRKSA